MLTKLEVEFCLPCVVGVCAGSKGSGLEVDCIPVEVGQGEEGWKQNDCVRRQ